jgi:hypothetical protein
MTGGVVRADNNSRRRMATGLQRLAEGGNLSDSIETLQLLGPAPLHETAGRRSLLLMTVWLNTN